LREIRLSRVQECSKDNFPLKFLPPPLIKKEKLPKDNKGYSRARIRKRIEKNILKRIFQWKEFSEAVEGRPINARRPRKK